MVDSSTINKLGITTYIIKGVVSIVNGTHAPRLTINNKNIYEKIVVKR